MNSSSAGGANIEAIYGLSSVQEGMLFHTLQSANAGVYFDQYAAVYDGSFDAARFERAWAAVAARHAPLRTLFTWDKRDQPLQIVRQRITLPWTHDDWRDLDRAQQTQRWQALLDSDRRQGFDLTRAPCTRFHLVRTGPERYRFLWSFHHIILDGWSLRLLLDEAWRHYRAGGQARLPAAAQYRDFIEWLASRDQDEAKTFWRAQLAGFDSPTTPRVAGVCGDGDSARVQRKLNAAQCATLQAAARRTQVTLNTLVVGAWALLLSRYCDSTDVVFGTTVAGRPTELAGATQMAGLFINTPPLRIRAPATATVGDWLRDVQSRQMHMRAYEHTPLVSVQRWSDVAPGTPLFDTLVVFENVPNANPADAATDAALPVVSQEQYLEFSHFPLALIALPGDGLELIAIYAPQRFAAQGMEQLVEHMENLLIAMAEQPAATLDDLCLMPRAAVRAQLDAWNDKAAAPAPDQCIHTLIEATAARVPQAAAVIDEAGTLTYADLNRRANGLARHLRALGVGANVVVPVVLPRSAEAIVAILAILKAGGAYAPLDPAFGGNRLRYVIEDIQAHAPQAQLLVVTHSNLARDLPSGITHTVCIDRDMPPGSDASDTNPDWASTADQLAYVMYTSGSTGRPKGAMITHRNLVHSTRAREDCYRAPLDAFLMLSSLATDSSVAGLFWSLCTGAALVLPRARQEQDPAGLSTLIATHGVTHLLALPSLYALMLEHGNPQNLGSLNTVIVAGEACQQDVVSRHFACLPQTLLYNEYGPSEATVWASVAPLMPTDARDGVTIGRPIAGTRIYILDRQGRPVPAGLAGELCIGGAGVARGYLGQPQRSADVFADDPYTATPGARLYRTADRARFRADGRIEFLGRLDNQLKVRGFRVEPEEIEHTLAAHPDITEAAVYVSQPNAAAASGTQLLSRLQALEPGAADKLLGDIEALSDDDVQRNMHRPPI